MFGGGKRASKPPPKEDFRTELVKYPGLGIARANALYERGVHSVADLRRKEIFDTLPFETQLNLKYPVDRKIPWEFADAIAKKLPKDVLLLGSYRRHRPTVGDLDLLTTRPLHEVVAELKQIFNIVGEFASGDKRYSCIGLYEGRYFHVDVFNCAKEELPTAILHWTGSLMNNVLLRQRAISRGMMLNQYGLFKDGKRIPVHNEEDVYRELGLEYRTPEQRNR